MLLCLLYIIRCARSYRSLQMEIRSTPSGAPGVKQQLAAVRMMFDWLIIGQAVPVNPASAVRGPKHVVKTGVTPVLVPPNGAS
jgi:site-specific recombinase XerC